MNAKEFKAEIRKIILEELRAQLPIIVESVITSIQKSAPQNNSPEEKKPIQESIKNNKYIGNLLETLDETDDITPSSPAPPQQQTTKKYTSNPILNAILNETTNDLRSRERMAGINPIGAGLDGEFSTLTSAEDPGATLNETPQLRSPTTITQPVTPIVKSVIDIKNELPPELARMFSKERNKAILEKSKNIK